MPVGWNCTASMLPSAATPVSSASAWPMPSLMTALVVTRYRRPAPPVAITVARATQAASSPVMRSRTTAPWQRLPSWISDSASVRSSTGIPEAMAWSPIANNMAWPVPSEA